MGSATCPQGGLPKLIAAVERMTGLEVVEVNISVTDVHLPDEEEEAGAGRVQ
jgi:uncharacterized alkaline shock family protein YloU